MKQQFQRGQTVKNNKDKNDRGKIGRHKNEKGFTLVELLVVLVILGLIAMFAVPQAMKYLGGAKSDSANIQISNIESILDLYRLETGRYPSQEEGLDALINQPAGVETWNGPYVKKEAMLNDPWGRLYIYRIPGEHGNFDLYSYGADNVEGGEGENRDAVNW